MKNSKFLLSLLLSFWFYSCSSVPDILVCRKRSPNSGFCTKTISNESLIVDDDHKVFDKTWLDLELESVYLPRESWTDLKKYIIKNCKKSHECAQDIDSWNRKLKTLD